MKSVIFALFVSLSLTSHATILNLNDQNTVVFDQDFNDTSVAVAANEIMKRCTPGKSIYLFLDTPGGSVTAGLNFADFVNGLPCKVHTITLFAASMGYITAQLLGNRYILPSGILMSHKASLQMGGEFPGSFQKRMALYENMLFDVDSRVASRLGVSVKKYQADIENELWLTANAAMDGNHADKIVLVRCDKSLQGERKITVRTFFGNATVYKSACPMVPGILRVSASSSKAAKAAVQQIVNKTPIMRK
jgi:ATP-dependent protease ClpP protease subunit